MRLPLTACAAMFAYGFALQWVIGPAFAIVISQI
jgi:hypothetical protein